MARKEMEKVPAKGFLKGMNALGYIFILAALSAAISWIAYVAYAAGSNGLGDHTQPEMNDSVTSQINTFIICYQGVIISTLFYFVFRHHFSQSN